LLRSFVIIEINHFQAFPNVTNKTYNVIFGNASTYKQQQQ